MIFTGFKQKSNQLFFNKQLPVWLDNLKNNSSNDIKKIVVLLDDISEKSFIQNRVATLFNLTKYDVDVAVFREKLDKSNEQVFIYTPKSFGWYGKIKTYFLENILTKKYDLLINYSKVENLYSNLLLLQCETAFRVGFDHLDNRFYDLLIDCDPEDVKLFNSELMKYLKILNKI